MTSLADLYNEASNAGEQEDEIIVTKPVVEENPQPAEPVPTVATNTVETQVVTEQHVVEKIQEKSIENEVVREEIPQQPIISQSTTVDVNPELINKIINITDQYRRYEQDKQKTISTYLKIEDPTESNVIYGILNHDRDSHSSLGQLVKLKEEERATRAFSLMMLPDHQLNGIRDLLTLFNKFETGNSLSNKVLFCKDLEEGLENLPIKAIEHLKPVNEILSLV